MKNKPVHRCLFINISPEILRLYLEDKSNVLHDFYI